MSDSTQFVIRRHNRPGVDIKVTLDTECISEKLINSWMESSENQKKEMIPRIESFIWRVKYSEAKLFLSELKAKHGSQALIEVRKIHEKNENRAVIYTWLIKGEDVIADNVYEQLCSKWWPRSDYEAEKHRIFVQYEELFRKQDKTAVSNLLTIGHFEQAETMYLSKCATWWERDDFDKCVINHKLKIEEERLVSERLEKIRVEKIEQEKKERLRLEQLELDRINKQAKLHLELNELRFTTYLTVGAFYRDHCTDFISASEYERANAEFVKGWLSENILPDKGGRVQLPDDEQTAAIGEVNHHTQVIARAGSGKTTTLVNRAYFLQKHCGVAPSEMLLLAFNSNAAAEIAERLDKRLNGKIPFTMTFHALAYALVHPEESILYDNPTGNHLALSRAFQNIINDHLNQPEFEILIREIMLAHFRQDWERILQGGLNLSKEEMLLLRRSRLNESLGGQAVKSFGEKVVADFLFEHNVAYKYERNHDWNNINYRPDFTLFATEKDKATFVL